MTSSNEGGTSIGGIGSIRCVRCHSSITDDNSGICPRCKKEKKCEINFYWSYDLGGDGKAHRIRMGHNYEQTKTLLEKLRFDIKHRIFNPAEWGLLRLKTSNESDTVVFTRQQRFWVRFVDKDGVQQSMPRAHYNWLKANPSFGEIPKGYVIHHLDGDSTNDDASNLVLFYGKYHVAYHFKNKAPTKATENFHVALDDR